MILDLMLLWIILAVILFVMVSSIIACFCGCCRKTRRDELMGVSGKVKITNPDILQNNNAPLVLSIIRTPSDDNVPLSSIPSSNASAKRSSTLGSNSHPGTATRSLPEIPVDAIKSASSMEMSANTNNFVVYNAGDTNSDLYATVEEHKISTSRSSKPKLSANMFGSSSQSNGTVTYEQIDENSTYNKIKEHPYAQVENDDENIASTSRMEHNSPDSMSIPREESTNAVDIPAASAITGNIAASNELPYMTPPIHHNFSGDSQDSTKGYTSITVREPLARIRPQNKVTNQDTSDSHYTVLSDDSDEMYAAIQDATYTSGSETYAQIQPVSSTSTYHAPPSNLAPSTSAASVTQKFSEVSIHSRQASSSSISSSLTNRNSPKEKRQANSPLPRPPDEMYAKVSKKPKYESNWCSSKDSVFSTDHDSTTSTFHSGPVIADQHLKSNEEVKNRDIDENIDEVDGIGMNGCYETLPERNYEMLNDVNQCPGYETVKEPYQNSGYESLPEPDSLTPGYERIRDPGGYEKLKYATLEEDISEPNYEELKPRKQNQSFHCYATIDKKKTMSSGNIPEPDYASLTRRNETEYDSWNNGDPFYERIKKRDDDDGDDADDNDKDARYNDRNNNHSDSRPKNERLTRNHSVSENNLSDLYSKVNKTKR